MIRNDGARFCPDLIGTHSGCRPEYLIRGGDALLARWRQPPSFVPVEGASHSILCYQCGGGTAVRKLVSGHVVGTRSRLRALTYIPTDGTEWSIDDTIDVVHLYLSPAAIERAAAQLDDRALHCRIDPFFAIDDPWMQGYFSMLISEVELYRGAGPHEDSLLLGETLHVLLRHLLRWHARGSPAATGRLRRNAAVEPLPPARLRRVLEFIRTHIADDLDLATLAGLAFVSPDHFIRSFRAATGATPYRYVQDERIRLACALLREGDMPLDEVARATGFGNRAYLATRFRRYMGTTPSAYRRRSR